MKNFQFSNFKFQIDRGFTLIELLVAIVVVSILTVVVIAALNPFEQIRKANDARRKSDLAELQKALELYYQDNSAYPPVTSLDDEINWGAGTNANAPYIAKVPKDPRNPSRKYIYATSADGQSYAIYASLERGSKDPATCGASCNPSFGVTSTKCGGSGCNYGVSSPNKQPFQ